MFDLISIGDTTLDVFLEIDEATVLCDINKEACRICFNYADKIPVKKVIKIPAVGNAANNAVGASRLGLKTALYTILGNDEIGRQIYQKLKKEGVSLKYIQFDKNKPSNYSTVLLYKGERTIFVYHHQRRYILPKLDKTKWIYLTSLAPNHDRLHQELIDFIFKTKTKLAFNPGTFQLREGLEKIKSILKLTSLLILNKEEAQKLVGDSKEIKDLLKLLKNQGPEIVVITDGVKGSYAFDGKNFYFQNILKTPVKDRTGAGDAYATGFLAGLICCNLDIKEAMSWGTINSASVVQKIGAQAGLLTKKELENLLKENKDKLKVKVI